MAPLQQGEENVQGLQNVETTQAQDDPQVFLVAQVLLKKKESKRAFPTLIDRAILTLYTKKKED